MSFAWPHLLWLLLLPAAMFAWELLRHRRLPGSALHPKILRAEIGRHDLALSPAAAPRVARRARPWLLLGLSCGIVALARPQWGRIEEPMFDQSREILLAVDLSRSMLAPDVKPARLDRAKLLIQALLEKLKGERVGLVVFSGTAFLQSPLSADYEILREFLPALNPDFLPEGGTNYSALLDTAMEAFGTTGTADRFLIILSDGEALDSDWKSRVDTLKKKGVRVIGLGVGTTAGAMIPDGAGAFVKDERGAVVLSKLESGTLMSLAEETGGQYRDASTWVDIAGLVEETVAAGKKGEFTETRSVRLVDRFQWPLALALWCFLVSFYYEFPVRPRPRAIALHPSRPGPKPTRTPAPANPAAGAALLVLGALFLSSPADAEVKIAPPTLPPASSVPNKAPTVAPEPPPRKAPEPPPLAKIVSRLSTADARTARDWADMAGETASWGERLKGAQQQVHPGPVHDALQAVGLGEKMDPKAADWPELRRRLEALLQPPQKQQQDQQKNQPDQKKDQSQKPDDSQQKQDQKQDNQKSDSKQDSPQQDSKKDQPSQDQKSEQSKPSEPPSKDSQSMFGDMNQPPPPPPSADNQKVGGAPEKKEEAAPRDPALAVPLEKLEQLKNQDSPAELFQLLQGDRSEASPKKPKKDW